MAHENVARAIIREIPITRISRFLDEFGDPNPVANGAGCGNGCGAGCIDGFGLTFDRYGHSELAADELQGAHRAVDELRETLKKEITAAIR